MLSLQAADLSYWALMMRQHGVQMLRSMLLSKS